VILYLDSSAVVKLIQSETESVALRRYLRRHPTDTRVSSALARVEVVRAVLDGGAAAITAARRLLGRLNLLELQATLLDEAATLDAGQVLRSLDAIHLASAKATGAELRAVVTYDARMAAAAASLRLPVVTPTA
jgi:predicted nucleic acid-binding protein